MKDTNAEAAIRMRLKYDWIVLLFGLLCVLIQLICKGDWGYFFLLISVFVSVEVFGVSLYRKLLNGGQGYHFFAKQTLDEQTGVGFILLCMVSELIFLIAISMFFLMNTVKHCVK